MPRTKCRCEEGLADWVMSYADMITILMALFVVLYALAGKKDAAKEHAVFESLREQFGTSFLGWHAALGGTAAHRRAAGTEDRDREAESQSGKPHGADQPDLTRFNGPRAAGVSRRGGVIRFADDEQTLNDAQRESLARIAHDLAGKPQKIEIRGHSSLRNDAGDEGLRDHWDIAYARCRATMEYLVAQGIPAPRIRLSVAGEHEPIPATGEPASFAQHARVEVFMLDEFTHVGQRGTPPLESPAAEPRGAEGERPN